MKIGHISDLHYNIPSLRTIKDWAEESDLEVIVCSGDFLGPCLPFEKAKEMQGALDYIRSNVYADISVSLTKVLEILRKKQTPDKKLNSVVQVYSEAERKFDERAEEQYLTIKEFLSQFPQTVLTVPGNWDSTKYFDILGEYDIHKKTREIDDVEFSGYGASLGTPIVLPPTRIIRYSEDELFDFFTKEMPEIAVTHVPPRKVFDKDSDGDHVGSFANLAYLRNPEQAPNILLCGHCHEGKGAGVPDGLNTYVVNPGNLGSYDNSPEKGVLLEIDYNNGKNIKVKPYGVGNEGVNELKGVAVESPSVTVDIDMK